MGKIKLEVACFSASDAVIAADGGADRIELCVDYSAGGLFPGAAAIAEVKEKVNIPVIVMIRPRSGDFCYSADEVKTMHSQIKEALEAGADGLVFGVLDKENKIDHVVCEQLLKSAGASECTFHRAFDKTPDLNESLQEIIQLGFKRVLSSGGKRHALNGALVLKRLKEDSMKKVEIMPGGTIRASNVKDVLRISKTTWIHTAAYNKEAGNLDVAELKNIVYMMNEYGAK